MAAEQKAKKEKDARQVRLGCLVLIALLIVVALGIKDGRSGAKKPTVAAKPDHKAAAIVHCENYVRDRLRAPSTADFPWLDREVFPLGSDHFMIKSYVDAQNAFGGTVRTNWMCEIKYAGGDEAARGNWQLLALELE